jgi:hypothetical protein
VILEQGKDFARFLLFGNRLKDVKVLRPQSVKIQPLGRPEDANTFWLIELSAAQIKAHRHLALQRKDDRPILVLLPALEFKEEKGPEPKPKPKERITVNADAVVIEGEGLKEIEKVTFNGKSIPFEVAEDGKSVNLKKLKANGVTATATTQNLEFFFKAGKTTVKVEVVNNKVETIQK